MSSILHTPLCMHLPQTEHMYEFVFSPVAGVECMGRLLPDESECVASQRGCWNSSQCPGGQQCPSKQRLWVVRGLLLQDMRVSWWI